MDEISIEILGNSPTNTTHATIEGDLQEYSATIEIENFKFEITKRLFIEHLEPLIDMSGYIKAENKIFKILKIKSFSDYMELWLYKIREVN